MAKIASGKEKHMNVLSNEIAAPSSADNDAEREKLRQTVWREMCEKTGTDPWLTVYESRKTESETVSVFCALVPDSQVKKVLQDSSWDLQIGSGGPARITYHSQHRRRTKYFRFGNEEGIEPLVLIRHFHDIRPSYIELSEEFRLFYQLYYDPKSNIYLQIDSNGDEHDIAIVESNRVSVRLREIRRFLSVKRMRLAIYFDIDSTSTRSLEELNIEAVDETRVGDAYIYRLSVGPFDLGEDQKSISVLRGKKLIPALHEKHLCVDPSEGEKQYADFFVGVNHAGQPTSYSCNPNRLANYFGANPKAPNYVTPVFFNREVLGKYYANTDKYSVEDGYLRCGLLWGLRMDNNHEKFVTVLLGDLGSELGYAEQLHWRSHNLPPEGKMSEVSRRRNFLAQFTDPDKADLIFKSTFDAFQRRWEAKFGWPLFKPLSESDLHSFTALRVPLNNSQAEFDGQVLSLARLLIDSLNEREIEKVLQSKDPEMRGISKFEKFLAAKALPNYQTHVEFMRNLYRLRHGASHRKGQNFKKASSFFELSEKPLAVVFENVLRKATNLIRSLESHFLASGHLQEIEPTK